MRPTWGRHRSGGRGEAVIDIVLAVAGPAEEAPTFLVWSPLATGWWPGTRLVPAPHIVRSHGVAHHAEPNLAVVNVTTIGLVT